MRGPQDAERLPDGVEPVLADLRDPAVVTAAGDNDVIVHVASAIPKQRAAPPEGWRLNDRIRREGTRHLLAAAARSGARLVLQSVTMLYAEAGEDWIDASNAQLKPADNLTSMLDAERMVDASPVDSLVLRQGLLFGAGTGVRAGLLDGARHRRLAPISDRGVWLSLLDPEDFAAIVVTALQHGLTGTYDAVSDTATITELITAAAEIISVEVPEAITLAEARERLDPAILSAWYISRRVSATALADHGIDPQRAWPQMLNKTSE